MRELQISGISGLNQPYMVYACNVYGMSCVLVSTINTAVPPTVSIILPPQFDTAPAVGIKIITSDGCERFEILYCSDNCKQFQDLEDFEFQDGEIYCFQG